MPEAYSEPFPKSKMECLAKIVNVKTFLLIFAKCSILVVWQGSKWASWCWNLYYSAISCIFSYLPCTTHQPFSSLPTLVFEEYFQNKYIAEQFCVNIFTSSYIQSDLKFRASYLNVTFCYNLNLKVAAKFVHIK